MPVGKCPWCGSPDEELTMTGAPASIEVCSRCLANYEREQINQRRRSGPA